MMRRIAAAAALAVMLSPWAGQAGERTVALNVTNLGCATCVPIVKKVLARIPGVIAVEVKEDGAVDAVASVTFDDNRTAVPALIAATTNAGYPSAAKN